MVEGTLKMSFGRVERGFKKIVGKVNWRFRRLMKVSWGETGGKRWGTMCLIFLRGFWANSVVIVRSKLDF